MNNIAGSRHDPESPVVSPDWQVEIDLHLHTTASDGLKTPSEIVQMAAEASLRIISITDHDTTEGLAEAQSVADALDGLTLIPGIELSTYTADSEVHLTAHFIDPANTQLLSTLRRLAQDRAIKARMIVERLAHLGINISWNDVAQRARGSVGRPHIARAMMAEGHAASISDAFDRYLDRGRPAYVSRIKLDTFEGLELIHDAGGVATVAHPRTVNGLGDLLPKLSAAGLAGLEVYAEKYQPDTAQRYAQMADQHGLVRSGGTDYHANGTSNEVLPGANGPPPETARLLYERAISHHGESGVGAKFDLESL